MAHWPFCRRESYYLVFNLSQLEYLASCI